MRTNFRALILWRDPRISGALFITGLVVLVALSFYSVLVVVTCVAIPCVVITLTVRALYWAKCALLKQPPENPFQHWLHEGWEIGGERMDSINRRVAETANSIVLEIKKVVLVEDFVDSLKGLLFLYVWYYIGRNISGLTLLFLGFIGLFTIPKIYDMYKREIDGVRKQLRLKYENCYDRIMENIPLLPTMSRSSKQHNKTKQEEAVTNGCGNKDD